MGVPVEKIGGNRVLHTFCEICINLGFLALYGYERKICLKLTVKTKKKVFRLNLFLISRFSFQKHSDL